MKRSYWDILISILIASITGFLFFRKGANTGITGSNLIVFVFAGIFIFSILLRRFLFLKPYYTSKYNILNSKFRYQEEFDLPQDLLFEKFKEVINNAGFKIVNANKKTGDIFAISSITFTSWGENIYISMNEQNGVTTVDFCSACIFQVVSWGKNERNYNKIIQEFEDSLTI